MTTAEKFKTKKIAKLCGILAYAFVCIFFVNIFGLIIWRSNTDVVITNVFYKALIAIIIIFPIISGLILITVSQIFSAKLLAYKSKIKEYRIRKYFSLAINCISIDDFEGAKYYYGFIPENRDERTYLYAILLYVATKSDNLILRENGIRKLESLLDYYNPNNIKF